MQVTLVKKCSNVRVIFLYLNDIICSHPTAQFSDPQLRRQFNLIGLDMRAFGTTQGLVGKDTYNPADSADDIYRFMVSPVQPPYFLYNPRDAFATGIADGLPQRALNLPPVHIFGISIGTCVATEIAIAQPDQVLSLTLCSPLPPTEVSPGPVESRVVPPSSYANCVSIYMFPIAHEMCLSISQKTLRRAASRSTTIGLMRLTTAAPRNLR